jgi:type IV pilus assembly protein PilX
MSTAKQITHRKNQGGFVLIASMMMLIVLAFMAVSMYHSFTAQENMSSNTKEKGRAFQMAQSTLQYAEYELVENGLITAPAACSGPPPTNTFVICNNASAVGSGGVTGPTETAPWSITNAMTYNPTTDDSNISITTTAGQNTFANAPLYYIQYLGYGTSSSCPSSPPKLYQVTALAYGATPNTVAVVQSVYQLAPTTCNLGSA